VRSAGVRQDAKLRAGAEGIGRLGRRVAGPSPASPFDVTAAALPSPPPKVTIPDHQSDIVAQKGDKFAPKT
jgi:hypothetical protein